MSFQNSSRLFHVSAPAAPFYTQPSNPSLISRVSLSFPSKRVSFSSLQKRLFFVPSQCGDAGNCFLLRSTRKASSFAENGMFPSGLELSVLKLKGLVDQNFKQTNSWQPLFSVTDRSNSGIEPEGTESLRKRKVVEHIFLLKAKENLSDEEEIDMLDSLYTSQYQTRGIIAISLGRIVNQNSDGFTHAVYMRFQQKEDLSRFYEICYAGVLKKHVLPYCHVCPNIGKQDFNYGVEFILLLSVIKSALGGPVEDALDTLAKLTVQFGSMIVQATQGSNINPDDREFTHAMVIRFPSFEAFNIFRDSSEYKDMWRLKLQPIAAKTLAVHFAVDPVGTEIM